MKHALCLMLVIAVSLTVGCRREQQAPVSVPVPAAQPAAAAQAAPAPAVVATVAELPDYPGATRVKYEAKADEGYRTKAELGLVSNDPFATVRAFYAEAIPANGWQVVAFTEKPGEAKWSLQKGTSVAKVEVETKGMATSISIERKDR